MQTLQTKQKIVISAGAVAVVALSATLALLIFAQIGADKETVPTGKMPVPESNVPDMIVDQNNPPTSGMPVPGNGAPEMIVTPS